MSETAEIQNLSGALQLIRAWLRLDGHLPGPAIELPFPVPPAILDLNASLGQLWPTEDKRPDLCGLLDGQDRILPPRSYRIGADGVVPFMWENQGVWGCGFKPDSSGQLWVTGPWSDDNGGPTGEWRPAPERIEDALIFVLLANLLWSSADCAMDDEEKPAWASRLLFSFAPWADFAGFWASGDGTRLRMQGLGWGVTASN